MKVKNWLLVTIRYILLFIIMGIVYGCLSAILDYLYIGKDAGFSFNLILFYMIYFYALYVFVYIPYTLVIYILSKNVPIFKNMTTQLLFVIIIGMLLGYIFYRKIASVYLGSDGLSTGKQKKYMIVLSLFGIVYIILNRYFLRKWLPNYSLKNKETTIKNEY